MFLKKQHIKRHDEGSRARRRKTGPVAVKRKDQRLGLGQEKRGRRQS